MENITSVYLAIILIIVSVFFYGLSKISEVEIEDRSDCDIAKGKVSHFKFNNEKKRLRRYSYVVYFVDKDGVDAIGISEEFYERKYYSYTDVVEFYYWKENEKTIEEKLEEYLQNIDKKEKISLKEEKRPVYRIHFVNDEVYERELESLRKTAKLLKYTGRIFCLVAIYILFFK